MKDLTEEALEMAKQCDKKTIKARINLHEHMALVYRTALIYKNQKGGSP